MEGAPTAIDHRDEAIVKWRICWSSAHGGREFKALECIWKSLDVNTAVQIGTKSYSRALKAVNRRGLSGCQERVRSLSLRFAKDTSCLR